MGIEEEKHDESQEPIQDVPVCLNCMNPVESLYHYCPNCGFAIGQLTPVMPYESIRWQADIWGMIWRQLWSKEVSFAGKLFRLFMIIWFVPVILFGIIPKILKK
jgi:hypothetical protein